ncbi:MAG: N-acetylmuramoyl-L-alanine amidase [Chitinophagaceae bacterium]|nr:N-acetylmuramoyl-L-alanine amidase [Chitinophagaceae bacterium]
MQIYFTAGYMLQVVVASALLYAAYWLLLRQTSSHTWGRFLLLGVYLLPWVLPLVRLPLPADAAANWPSIWPDLPLAAGQLSNDTAAQANPLKAAEWHQQLHWSYLLWLPTVVLLGQAIAGVLRLYKLKRCCKQLWCSEGTAWVGDAVDMPFSWCGQVFVPTALWQQPAARPAILLHENAHAVLHHSVDLYATMLVRAVGWWNPVWWLAHPSLKLVHEYQADAICTRQLDKHTYAWLLATSGYNTVADKTSHAFFQSPLKARITMMMQSKKMNWQRWLLVPVLAILIGSFGVASHKPAGLPVLKPLRVLVDAGHGGNDPGVQIGDLQEKALTLQLAKAMQRNAAAFQLEVVLTRDGDELPVPADRNESLRKRVAMIEEVGADVVLSLHIGAAAPGKNRATKRGVDAFVPANNPAMLGDSKRMASLLLQALADGPLPVNKNLLQRKEQGIYILDKSSKPVVLVELGYLTNEQDAAILQQAEKQAELAEKLLAGLRAYAQQR